MYTQHFRLTELPFSIAPNPRYLYLSAQHREALAHLLYGIGVGGGFVVLTGEVGTGKTTLCRALLDQLPEDVDIALIFNPRLNSRELLAGICDELNIPYPGPRASLKQLIDALNQYLLDAHARGRRVIVLIDEAQNLRFDVLEQVRLLTNLETNQTKLLQIILVGQPELNQVLERPNLRQLAQRITARYHLNPLSLVETRDYIRHRMTVASGSERCFTQAAVRVIHRRARGIPRLVNLMADRALLGAYTLGRLRVTAAVARRAARELMPARMPRSRARLAGLLALLGLSLGLALYVGAIPGPFAGKPASPPAAGPEPPASAPADQVAAEPARTPAVDDGNASQDSQPAGRPESADGFAGWIAAIERGRKPAYDSVFSAWSVAPDAATGDPCEAGKASGHQCQPVQFAWLQLRQLNLPMVLEFQLPGGGRRYVALLAVAGDTLKLTSGSTTGSFQVGDILPLWTGNAWVVWKPGTAIANLVKPGETAPIVSWVRRQLGATAAPGPDNVYDDALKPRVVEFQKSRGLRADGLLGMQTLLNLQTARQDPAVPLLVSPTPR